MPQLMKVIFRRNATRQNQLMGGRTSPQKHMQLHIRRQKSFYLAGIRSRDEQFQGLSFQLCQPSVAVLTPYPSFAARGTSAAWGRWSCPEAGGAAQGTRRFSPDPRRDGPRWSREGPWWGNSWAWGRGACGAWHGAGSLWGGTCTGAWGFLVGLSVPCVREEGGRFGWRSVRHLWK